MASFQAESDTTVVRQVANYVRAHIVREKLKRGAPLPSYRALASDLGVAYLTVKRGMDDLEAEGIISRQQGRGMFVAKELFQTPRALNHLGLISAGARPALFTYDYLTEIMRGISLGLPPRTDLHAFSIREDGLVNAGHLDAASIDGVILLGVENDEYLKAFAQWGTPGVVVDYCSQAAPLDYVACDNRAAARQLVNHLAALGHRRVAYTVGFAQNPVQHPRDPQAVLLLRDSSDVRERLEESVCALREGGMLFDLWTMPGHWAAFAADEILRRAKTPDCPTALLTDSHYSGRVVLEELTRRGLRAPEDVSVCALASAEPPTIGGRRLTTCRFDFVGMGRQAIELLVRRCQEPRLEKPHVHRIGFAFEEGQTTGRAGPA